MRADKRKRLVLLSSGISSSTPALTNDALLLTDLGDRVLLELLCPNHLEEDQRRKGRNLWSDGWVLDDRELADTGVKRTCNGGRNALHGRRIRVSAYDGEPWVNIQEDGALAGGLCVDQMDVVAELLDFEVEEYAPATNWGLLLPNGTWTGSMGDVINGASDVALSVYKIWFYSLFGDMTTANTHLITFAFVVPAPVRVPRIRNLIYPLEPEVWLFFGVSLLLVTGVFLVIREADRRADGASNSVYDALIMPYAIIFQEFHIVFNRGQLFRLWWSVSTFLLTASYSGQLKASLVLPEFEAAANDTFEVIRRGMDFHTTEVNMQSHEFSISMGWSNDKYKAFVKYVKERECCYYDLE